MSKNHGPAVIVSSMTSKPCSLPQFGAMMSATDPVATIAVLNEVGAPRQLRTLIEGESLVNDGTAYVLFFLLRVRQRPPAVM